MNPHSCPSMLLQSACIEMRLFIYSYLLIFKSKHVFAMLIFFLENVGYLVCKIILCSFSFCTFWTWPDTSFSRRLQALSLQKRACFGESRTAPTHLFLFDITIKRRKSFLSEDLSVPASNGLER